MSEQPNTNAMSNWVYVVIALVAIIGLLAGLLVSKATTPQPVLANVEAQTETSPNSNPDQRRPPPPNADPSQQDVRRIVRNLPRDRRREILQQAMKNLASQGFESPRELMKERDAARRKSFDVAKAEPFDVDAMRKAIEDVNAINQKLVDQGIELTIEVMQLMTPEERKAAAQRGPQTRRERVRQRREDRRQRREQD